MTKVLNRADADDLLTCLNGWTRDLAGIGRSVRLSDAQYAELRERVKVCADAMRLRLALVRDGEYVRLTVSCHPEGLTASEVALAARIDDIARSITGETTPATPPPAKTRDRRWWRHGVRRQATA